MTHLGTCSLSPKESPGLAMPSARRKQLAPILRLGAIACPDIGKFFPLHRKLNELQAHRLGQERQMVHANAALFLRPA
jgi:hypothetical protein